MKWVEWGRSRARTICAAFGGLLTVCILVPAHAGGITASTEEAVARGISYMTEADFAEIGYYGYGAGFADLDGDGDEDIVILGATDRHIGVYENDGAGFFTDRSATSGLPDLQEASALAFGDIDGDGDVDIYITQINNPNVLARNDGNFQFTDIAVASGTADTGASKAPVFADFDEDGRLDIYLCNYTGLPGDGGQVNRLYRNLGGNVFTDVAAQQTVDHDGQAFQAQFFDFDRDGDLDLYVSNDNRPEIGPTRTNQLWRRAGGTYVNISAGSGADVTIFSMGVACGDLDGNGWPDLYCTNLLAGLGMDNPLLLNQGDGTFVESGVAYGVDNMLTSWGSVFYDFTNNGWLDLYVNNMWANNTLFLTLGGFPCVEMAGPAGMTGMSTTPSFVGAVADVDGDGDLDMLVNDAGRNTQLFINHEGSERNWIRFRVVGLGNNPDAIGASVDARFGPMWRFREIHAGGNGYLGQNELTVHYGADDATVADEVVIRWPAGGPTRTLTNYRTNETWPVYAVTLLGDTDFDGDRDLDDFAAFSNCFDAALFVPECAIVDFDGDGDVDLDDFDQFLLVFDESLADCDGDGTEDLRQILLDPALDLDGDGRLDSCSCAGDFDGNGAVGFSDLNTLLTRWGPCRAECTPDLDGSGTVGFADLNQLLSVWGPCG